MRRHAVQLLLRLQLWPRKKIKDLGTKLTEVDKEKKSVEIALAGTEKQAEDLCLQLCKAEELLAIACEQIEAQKKGLEKKEEDLAGLNSPAMTLG